MNKQWRCTLCCLMVLSLWACNGTDKKADRRTGVLDKPPFAALTDSIAGAAADNQAGLYFRRGELLARNNLHELAAADYKRSWKLHPDELTGLRYAATLSIIGDTDEAVRLLRECRDRYPANISFSGMLGDLYQQSGKTSQALQLYEDQLKKDSMNFEAWYEKGLLLEKLGDTTAALAALNNAYRIQPISTYALELAHLYAESGKSQALALADEVLQKDTNHELLDPLFIKGIYYSNTGQYKLAIIQFDSCIGRDWKFTDAYLEKGIAFFRQKKYPEAMEVFRLAIRVSNTAADGYYWIGRCYEALGQKEDAILFYQRTLALDKTFKEAAEGIKRLR